MSRTKNLFAFSLSILLVAGSLCLLLDLLRQTMPMMPLNFLPLQFSFNLLTLRLSQALKGIGIALAIIAATVQIGFFFRNKSFIESFAVGFAVIAFLLPITTCIFPLTSIEIAVVIFALDFIFIFFYLKKVSNNIFLETVNFWINLRYIEKVLVIISAVGLLWAFLSNLVIPSGMDALAYHLNLGLQYLVRGKIMPLDSTVYYQYMQNGEIYLMLGTALDKSGIASNILTGFFLIAATISGMCCAEEVSRNNRSDENIVPVRAKIISLSAFAICPLTIILAAHTKTDLIAFALVTVAFASFFIRDFSIVQLAFLLGSAIGVKITSAYAVLPLLLFAFYKERLNIKKIVVSIFVFILPFSWWCISNLYWFNKLLPQGGNLFSSILGYASPPYYERIFRIFASFITFIQQGIDGPFGVLALVATFSLIPHIRKSSSLFFPALASMTGILLWLVTGGGSHSYASGGLFRFALPVFGIILPTGAVALEILLRDAKKGIGILLVASLLLSNILTLSVPIIISFVSQPFLFFLAGSINETEYMNNWNSSHKIIKQAEELLPMDAKVLSVGENRLFHLGRSAVFDLDQEIPRALKIIHAKNHNLLQFGLWLKHEKITHLLYAPAWYKAKINIGLAPQPECDIDRIAFESFLSEEAWLIAKDDERKVYLYELK